MTQARTGRWLPVAIAVAAAAMIAGGVLSLGSLGGSPAEVRPAPTAGHKRPAEFGLPEYPGAAAFYSEEPEPGVGSVAFTVSQATAARVTAFYRDRLRDSGWKLLSEQTTTFQPGSATPRGAPGLKGPHLKWRHEKEKRELMLSAFDLPGPAAKVRVVMGWERRRKRSP